MGQFSFSQRHIPTKNNLEYGPTPNKQGGKQTREKHMQRLINKYQISQVNISFKTAKTQNQNSFLDNKFFQFNTIKICINFFVTHIRNYDSGNKALLQKLCKFGVHIFSSSNTTMCESAGEFIWGWAAEDSSEQKCLPINALQNICWIWLDLVV